MKVSQLLEKIQKLVDEGHGDAVLVHTDTRSGITESVHTWGSVETFYEGESGNDFYADLKDGQKYIVFYEGD